MRLENIAQELNLDSFEAAQTRIEEEMLACFKAKNLDFKSPKNFLVENEKTFDHLCLTLQELNNLDNIAFYSVYKFLLYLEKTNKKP